MTNTTIAVNLAGLTEKCTTGRWKALYYVDSSGAIIAKQCRTCAEVKTLDSFYKDNSRLGGRMSACRECKKERNRHYREANADKNRERRRQYYESKRNEPEWVEKNRERNRQYYEANADKLREGKRQYYEANADKLRERVRQHRANNPEQYRLRSQRRRARLDDLPDTLTTAEWDDALDYFGGGCALTGSTDDIHMEHILPVSIGYGGTTAANCVPMRGDLNSSKGTDNIFDWYYGMPLDGGANLRFNIEQSKFDRLIEYLAEMNDMTTEEYEEYTEWSHGKRAAILVDWCHDNPRTIDEIKAEQTNEDVAI